MHTHSRFAAQIAAAAMMTLWGGVTLQDLGQLLSAEPALLGAWAVPFTVFAVVGVINAFNMLDGMDGLAGTYALLAFTPLATAAVIADATVSAVALFTLSAAVAAFLLANLRLPGRPRALVFMGNSGSLFLGLALAWFLVSLSQGEAPVIAPVTALWILAIPLMAAGRALSLMLCLGQWRAQSHVSRRVAGYRCLFNVRVDRFREFLKVLALEG